MTTDAASTSSATTTTKMAVVGESVRERARKRQKRGAAAIAPAAAQAPVSGGTADTIAVEMGTTVEALAQKCSASASTFRATMATPKYGKVAEMLTKLNAATSVIDQVEALKGGFGVLSQDVYTKLLDKCVAKMRYDEARIAQLEGAAARADLARIFDSQRQHALESAVFATATKLETSVDQLATELLPRLAKLEQALPARSSVAAASSSSASSSSSSSVLSQS